MALSFHSSLLRITVFAIGLELELALAKQVQSPITNASNRDDPSENETPCKHKHKAKPSEPLKLFRREVINLGRIDILLG